MNSDPGMTIEFSDMALAREGDLVNNNRSSRIAANVDIMSSSSFS